LRPSRIRAIRRRDRVAEIRSDGLGSASVESDHARVFTSVDQQGAGMSGIAHEVRPVGARYRDRSGQKAVGRARCDQGRCPNTDQPRLAGDRLDEESGLEWAGLVTKCELREARLREGSVQLAVVAALLIELDRPRRARMLFQQLVHGIENRLLIVAQLVIHFRFPSAAPESGLRSG
jgi:hypothetical protein